jgi:hypothetical protein
VGVLEEATALQLRERGLFGAGIVVAEDGEDPRIGGAEALPEPPEARAEPVQQEVGAAGQRKSAGREEIAAEEDRTRALGL